MKLRVALAVRLSAVVATALVVLAVFVVRQTRADLISQVDDRMRGALSSRAQERRNPQAPPRPVATEGDDERIGDTRATANLVFAPDGRLLEAVPSGTGLSPDPLPIIDRQWISTQLARPPGPGSARSIASTGGVVYRIMASGRTDGNLEVEATPLASVDASIADLIRTLTIGSALVLAGAALTAFAVLRRSLRPLGSMANAATRIAEGDVTLGPGAPSPHAELHELGVALDSMVGRLRASIDERTDALAEKEAIEQRLRRFVSDASHELQTPITSIRGWAELFRRGGLAAPNEIAKAMRQIETESARMGRLVDDLLLLARSDEQREFQQTPVDLGPLCIDAIATCQAIDPNRAVSFTDERFSGAMVQGNPDTLRQVIDNLLTNARRHTPPDTPVAITIRHVGAQLELSVTDRGPGFPVDGIADVFDRFWRDERGRSDQHHQRGSGLGLAIVRAIVVAHGGTVSAANHVAGGAILRIRLPIE